MSHRRAPTVPSLVLAGVVAAGALGLTACGESTIETSEIEGTISKQFKAQGVELHDVSCKGQTKAEVDAPVSCTGLNPSNTKLVLEGAVTKVDDGKASFRVRAVRGVAKGTTVAAEAKTLLEKQVGDEARALTCPAEVPIPTRPTEECELTTTDGKRYATTLTIDARSRISVKVADEPR